MFDDEKFFFTSLETCFDLYWCTAVWKEKVHFKEKHNESDSLITNFYAIQTKYLCCAKQQKKYFDFTLKNTLKNTLTLTLKKC